MTVAIPVAVGRGSNMAEVERITLDVANSVAHDVDGVAADVPPTISYPLGFEDYVVRFAVTFRVLSYAHQGAVRSALVQRLEARYLREGITMFYPVGRGAPGAELPDGEARASLVATPRP